MAIKGAVLGDILGSQYEFNRPKNLDWQNIPLIIDDKAKFTDDSVMTIAVADAFLDAQPNADIEWIRNRLIRGMQRYGKEFPHAGYGGMFRHWLRSKDPQPYGSYGNGSAMELAGGATIIVTVVRMVQSFVKKD